jgi:hypothetical protein
MNNTSNDIKTESSNELYTGLISTGFTILSFILYKVVKKYTLNSDCKNNQLHITLSSLDDKINQTHTYITTFFESMKEEVEKQDKYNRIVREHRNATLDKNLDEHKSSLNL